MHLRFLLLVLLAALPGSPRAQTLGPEWAAVATTASRIVSLDASRLGRTETGATGWMSQVPTSGQEASFDALERRRLAAGGIEAAERVVQTQTAFEADCDGRRLMTRESVSLGDSSRVVATLDDASSTWRPVTEGSVSGLLVGLVCEWRAAAPDTLRYTYVEPQLLYGMEMLMRSVKYPTEERRAGRQGRVVLGFVVTTEGIATQIRVVRSVSTGLDRAAVDAVRDARFSPALRDGVPVEAESTVPIIFLIR